MSLILKAFFLIGLIAAIALLSVKIFDAQEVFIVSQESKTQNDGEVFNRIQLFSSKEKDIWMMNQSHHGVSAKESDWDRLAIVVDKTKSPKVARFYQLEAGPLEWSGDLKPVPFKVSCFMCHNNGPRAIRPKVGSGFDPKVAFWNLKIKLYGRVVPSEVHNELDRQAEHPFRMQSGYENEILKVSACTKCHNESGFLARGFLKRQQGLTIGFLVASGQMPPPGFSISEEDRQKIDRFVKGF